jgi:hypothetical protein
MAGIDHENLPLADNYSGVATGFVLDFTHAIGQVWLLFFPTGRTLAWLLLTTQAHGPDTNSGTSRCGFAFGSA